MTRALRAHRLLRAYQSALGQALCQHSASSTQLPGHSNSSLGTGKSPSKSCRDPCSGMAASGVISPTKQAVLSSPSKPSPQRHPLSPYNATMGTSIVPIKRSSSVLQALCRGSGSSSSPAHKRQENVDPGISISPASLPVHSPATPTLGHHDLSTEIGARGSSGCTGQHSQQQSQVWHRCTPEPTLQVRPSPVGQPAAAHHHQRTSSISTCSALAVDPMPSPRDVLDSPPELEPVVNCGGLHSGSDLLHQQQHMHVMSGRRMAARFDVPLELDWLAGVPEHLAELGSGRLELIIGPMFAGKTTQLINRVREVSGDGQIAVAVKSSKDERYGCHWVVTHDGRCMRCYTADTLQEFKAIMGPHYQKLQVLAIDEAQFFPDLVEFCRSAVDDEGKHVIVAGLSGDFKRQRFGDLLELMPLADSIKQLKSKCAFCNQDALFSLRMVESGPQALVGGDDKYRATCRRCYLSHSHTTH